MNNIGRYLLFAGAIGLVALIYIFDLHHYMTLESIKSKQGDFMDYYQNHPLQTIAVYMIIYIFSIALSIPGAVILTLLGGALFGVILGTLIISFASTIGATLAFLSARYLLREWVEKQFRRSIKKINKGVRDEGAFYLFSLRLIPVVPFFIINLVMGLTSMRTSTFFIVSQIGMLPGTLIYVNAGTQLSQINSLQGILTPSVLISFIALGLVPVLIKKTMGKVRKKKGHENVKV